MFRAGPRSEQASRLSKLCTLLCSSVRARIASPHAGRPLPRLGIDTHIQIQYHSLCARSVRRSYLLSPIR